MTRRKANSGKYDLTNLEELKCLGSILAPMGIHLEVNLFQQPYVILEDRIINKINALIRSENEASHS